MSDEDESCCICGTTKFVGRVNTGEKFYCNTCMKKINDSGMDYWKPCSNTEFFESMSKHMKKGRKSTENFPLFKKQIREIKKEVKNKTKSADFDESFDYADGFNLNEVYDQD